MKLSQTIKYAIRATVELSRGDPDRPIPSSKLAKRGQLPERFLLQVLRRLVEADVLRSARGVDGGYFLSRNPSQITVLDIVESFEPLESTEPEVSGLTPGAQERVTKALDHISEVARNELRKLNLADLSTEAGCHNPDPEIQTTVTH